MARGGYVPPPPTHINVRCCLGPVRRRGGRPRPIHTPPYRKGDLKAPNLNFRLKSMIKSRHETILLRIVKLRHYVTLEKV
jgi:hypothetical protein